VGRVTGAQNESGYRALFASLAQGTDIRVSIPPFDRLLRVGAGGLLILVGISTGSWIAMSFGGLLAFLGVYDRCPVWRAITKRIASKTLR
jgi:thioredoxin 1